jgi:anti-sigma factor RsiW
MSERVTEAELHAWLDGRLSAARRREVEAWLASRPEEAARLNAYRDADARLRARFDTVLAEPVPAPLLDAARERHIHFPRIAAAILLALASAAGGWFGHDVMQSPMNVQTSHGNGLAHEAAIAHAVFTPDLRHPVEVAADEQAHLATWLSKRLKTHLALPRLEPLGYSLVGGRLLPGNSGAVAQLMYRDANGKRITLYLAPEYEQQQGTPARFAFTRVDGLNVLYWTDVRFGCAVAGDLSRQELIRVAHAAQEQLQET